MRRLRSRIAPVVVALARRAVGRRLLAAAIRAAGLADAAFEAAAADPKAGMSLARAGWEGGRSGARVASPAMPEDEAALDAIPSETSSAERRFLHAFFGHIWPGAGDVVEIGPFLGGTTRAIALGMLANPRCDSAARLYTFDRFESYHDPAVLQALLADLDDEALSPTVRDTATRGSFRAAFDAIHRTCSYSELLVARDVHIPESREQQQAATWELDLTPARPTAAFIDGCKSWYSTKLVVTDLGSRIPRGGYVLFQDYGWYTCFWIPLFAHAIRESLRLVAYVDSTYAFQLLEPLDPERVDERFADSPSAPDVDAIALAFGSLQEEALRRGDGRAVVIHEMQHAAALAYVGAADEARARLDALGSAHRRGPCRALIAAARRSPTYRPVGLVPGRYEEVRL